MERHFEYLIIGGGLTAATAMKELVKRQPGASIGLIAEESEPPYNRPPLSKEFLLGKVPRERVFLLGREFYEENGIHLAMGRRATAIDTAHRRVRMDDANEMGYDQLLIASGCTARRLTCPGAGLGELYYLRTLREAEALRRAADSGRQAVVIGGGFIGLEVASVLSQLDVSVTIVHRADRLFEKFGSDAVSDYYEELYAAHGVHTVYGDEAAVLAGSGRVEHVSTVGGRTLPCDFAVAGIGVYPDMGFLEGSGIETGNGVIVDSRMMTSVPGVYAAGDIANFVDPLYGRRRRIEHWDNAIRQGKIAAANMAGGGEEYCCVSYFYSTVFGETFECFGDMSDFDLVITRGSFENRSIAVFYLKEGILQSAFMFGRPGQERSVVKKLINERRPLQGVQDRLSDEGFELQEALAA